jgi:hypothetical protein
MKNKYYNLIHKKAQYVVDEYKLLENNNLLIKFEYNKNDIQVEIRPSDKSFIIVSVNTNNDNINNLLKGRKINISNLIPVAKEDQLYFKKLSDQIVGDIINVIKQTSKPSKKEELGEPVQLKQEPRKQISKNDTDKLREEFNNPETSLERLDQISDYFQSNNISLIEPLSIAPPKKENRLKQYDDIIYKKYKDKFVSETTVQKEVAMHKLTDEKIPLISREVLIENARYNLKNRSKLKAYLRKHHPDFYSLIYPSEENMPYAT